MVTVLLPVHNERENLAPLLAEIAAALRHVPHEVIAVDDGSSDGSLDELEALRDRQSGRGDAYMRVVALRRRTGQSAAFVAGLASARGEVIVTLDADGQNDPHDIPRLLRTLEADHGLTAVVGYRRARADSRWKRLQSAVANAVRNQLTGDAVRDTGCALKAMRRDAVARLPQFDGMHRFLPTLLRMQGAQVLEVPVADRPRRHGRSKYGMWDRLWRGLRDALGVRWLKRRALRYEIREERP